MTRPEYPITPAVRALRAAAVEVRPHEYAYVEHGGTAASAKALGLDEHCVIKTLILEDDAKRPLVVLMHGDREVSTQRLARLLGCRDVRPCTPEQATRHTGYLVGGTSPFGTRKKLPIYAERSVFDLARLYLNGGKRGFLVELTPEELQRALSPILVDVATT